MERFFLAALCRAPSVGSRVAASLVRVFGSAQDAWHARAEALRAAHLSPERAAALHDFCRRNEALPEKIAAACEKGGISLFVPSDEAYPARLKEIYNPPQTLFCRGSLDCLKHPAVAMVGARHASAYGKGAAEDIALGLAERGFVVVSGAARGIDTASHKGALQVGATVAVLGCGVDVARMRGFWRRWPRRARSFPSMRRARRRSRPFSPRVTASSAALRTAQSSSRRRSGAAL